MVKIEEEKKYWLIKKGRLIMNSKGNIFWGVFLLVAAAYVIVGNLGLFGDVSFWTIGFSIILLAWFIRSLFKVSFGGMLFSLAFGAILFDEALHIEQLTPFPVLAAALLGTIGFKLIFKKKKVKQSVVGNMNYVQTPFNNGQLRDESIFKCNTSFGSTVKYVNSPCLVQANVSNAFGSLSVYFDEANLGSECVTINVDNSFGKLALYLPKEWNVTVNAGRAFGNVTEVGNCIRQSDARVYIEGETSFGQLEINYI